MQVGLLNALLATALAVLAAAVSRLCRAPALAHTLWLLVLLKLVTPPLVPVAIPRPAPSVPTEQAAAVPPVQSAPDDVVPAAAATEPLPAVADTGEADGPASILAEGDDGLSPRPGADELAGWHIPWQLIVAALWLTGSGVWWSLAAVRLRHFRRLLRSARLAPPAVQGRAEELAGRLGLAHCPGVWLLPALLPPLLWSLLGPPRVLLPSRLWHALTEEQQDTLLAHELAHLRRRDHWVRWLELAALGLYWWLPVAWWARRELQTAEELLCDARVVRTLPGAADAYAAALVQTVVFLSVPRPALPGAASGLGEVRALKRRLTMIMRGTISERLPRAGAWAVLALGAAALALRPGWAQTQVAGAQAPDTAPSVSAPGRSVTAPAAAAPDRPAGHTVSVAVPAGSGRALTRSVAIAGETTTAQSGGGALARPANAADTQAARDEVELLRAQLDTKRAELLEARALLGQAQHSFDRLQQLHKQGAVSVEEMDKVRTDLAVRQARVAGKEAQLRESQLRLSQAERRLGSPRRAVQRTSAASDLAPNPRPTTAEAAPAVEPATRPQTTTRSVPGRALNTTPTKPASEDRLRQLERQLESLQREVDALRQQLRSRGAGGRTSGLRTPAPVQPAQPAAVPVPEPVQPSAVPLPATTPGREVAPRTPSVTLPQPVQPAPAAQPPARR
jgi:beta-lactamase regulating signal transducer with metallopeptidase domain